MRIALSLAVLCLVGAINLEKKTKDSDMAEEMAAAAGADAEDEGQTLTTAMAIAKAERKKAAKEKEEALEVAKDAMKKVAADATAKKEEEDCADEVVKELE